MIFITIDDEPQAVLYPLVTVHCKAFPSCSPMTLHRAPHPMQRASIPSDAERPAQFSALLDGYHHARKDAYLYLALALIMIHDATDDHERLRMDQQFEEHILNSKGEDGLQPIVGNRSKVAHRILISDWLTYSAPSVWPLIRSAGPSIKVLAEVLRDEHCKDRYFLRLFAHRLVSQPNRSRKFIRELVLTLWGVHLRPIEEISARQWEGRTQLLVPHFEPGMSGEDVWVDTDRLAKFEHWYALTVRQRGMLATMVALASGVRIPLTVSGRVPARGPARGRGPARVPARVPVRAEAAPSPTRRSTRRSTVPDRLDQRLYDAPRRRSAKRSAVEMMGDAGGEAVGSEEEKALSLAHSLVFGDGSTSRAEVLAEFDRRQAVCGLCKSSDVGKWVVYMESGVQYHRQCLWNMVGKPGLERSERKAEELVVVSRNKRRATTFSQHAIISYPGSKQWACHLLREIQLQRFPDAKHLYSPFCGALSFELDCASRGMTVSANDLHLPLILFWRAVQSHKPQLIAAIKRVWDEFHQLSTLVRCRRRFYEIKNQLVKHRIGKLDPIQAAAYFWLVTKRSPHSLGTSGGYDHKLRLRLPRFHPNRLDRCGDLLSRFTFSNLDYSAYLDGIPDSEDPSTLLFIDPPYRQMSDDGSGTKPGSLYGFNGSLHRPFTSVAAHERLRDRLKRFRFWMLVHEDNEDIREVYRGYEQQAVRMVYKEGSRGEIVVFGPGCRGVECVG